VDGVVIAAPYRVDRLDEFGVEVDPDADERRVDPVLGRGLQPAFEVLTAGFPRVGIASVTSSSAPSRRNPVGRAPK
jgi:hypothetical protein